MFRFTRLPLAICAAMLALSSSPVAADAPKPVYTTLDEVLWTPMDPSEPDGPKMAVLWGDPQTGPYGMYQSYPAGSDSPLHSFSRDQGIVMVRGTTRHWLDGQTKESAKPKPSGAFMLMPAGVKHYAACDVGEDCVVLVTQDGPLEFRLEQPSN